MTTYTCVEREGNALLFKDKVNDKAVRDFLWTLGDARARGYQDLVLDFSRCQRAYPEGMLPIVAVVDSLRNDQVDCSVALPSDGNLRRLFLNCNWAHFIAPGDIPASEMMHERHLAVRRYRSGADQQEVVNIAMDIVMKSMEVERDVLSGLEWSINEVTDNVLNHADSELGGLVQVSTFKETGKISFVVADSGRGILHSMREGFPFLRSDAEAILEAVKQGVTRSPEAGQGNGLAGTLRIATASGGAFKLTSGRAQLEVIRPPGSEEFTEHTYRRSARLELPGTVVSAELGTNHTFRLQDVLGSETGIEHIPWDIVDSAYSGHGHHLTVSLMKERGGFGTRQAGEQLRTKLKNLLSAEPDQRVVIDWAGVPVVSSSFADEAIGRLFVDLGPVAFGSRIQSVGMEPLVRSLVDRAVMQRVAQSAQRG